MALGFGQKAPAAAQASSLRKYEKGAVIAQEGAGTKEMYVLMQGSVAIFKNYQKFNQIDLGYMKTGDCFGETTVFMDRTLPASIVASDDSTMLVLDKNNAAEVFAKNPEYAFSIIGNLSRRLDSANGSLGKADSAAAPVGVELSKTSSLFPQGHGQYSLPLTNGNTNYIYPQAMTCPVCGCKFESLSILQSRLRRESTDKDLRVHYADVEPMFYDIVTCPACLFSTPVDMFSRGSSKMSAAVNQELSKFIPECEIKVGADRDTFTVFAGYYLALRAIPVCFDEPQMTTASLWQKLSRIYKDCADEKMYLTASQNALRDYEHIYQHFRVSEKVSQQICYILGDLYERLRDFDKARNYFFLAKSNNEGTPAMKNEADKRLEAIKEIMNS